MISPEKIEEWIKEAKERPGSAAIILQYIANRLRDLTERNEELRAENLALRTEKKVEEYERRITALEYQLDLLKRQFGGDPAALEGLSGPAAPAKPARALLNLLAYDVHGRILRLETDPDALAEGAEVGRVPAVPAAGEEPLRLLAVSGAEELLFVFTSGRVSTRPVGSIPTAPAGAAAWESLPQPDEPRGGETLACIAPISRLALAEYFVQASLRGWVKKVGTSLAPSILEKHYIGTGATQKGDRTISLTLGKKDDRLVLVTREGYLLCLEVKGLPFSVEEAIKFNGLDYLAAAFAAPRGRPVLVMTQLGKLIHLAEDRLEPAGSLRSRGQPLFSQQRREKGARVVGAAAVQEADWTLALHRSGRLTLHSARALIDSGTLAVQDELAGFAGME